MRIEKQKLKTVVLALALAGMLWPTNTFAQEGGLLGGYEEPTGNRSLFDKGGGGLFESLTLQNFGEGDELFGDITLQNFGENQDNNITLQNFGEEAPLGNGWLVLMGAGFGYAALKSKKNNKKQTKSIK